MFKIIYPPGAIAYKTENKITSESDTTNTSIFYARTGFAALKGNVIPQSLVFPAHVQNSTAGLQPVVHFPKYLLPYRH